VRAFCLAVMFAALCLRVVNYATADGADPSYLGAWKLTAAAAAPWVPAQRQLDAAERARLIGQTIVFKATAIAGPSPFACRAPHYKFRDFTAAMIFQRAFEKTQPSDNLADPERIAATLGFAGPGIKTLETGCDLDFRFVDASTAQVGLNDVVYTLRKQ